MADGAGDAFVADMAALGNLLARLGQPERRAAVELAVELVRLAPAKRAAILTLVKADP